MPENQQFQYVSDEFLAERHADHLRDFVHTELMHYPKGLPISGERILREITKELRAFDIAQPTASAALWTTQTKRVLHELAGKTDPNIEQICTNEELGKSELMLDVLWWWRKERHLHERVLLAVECEWASRVGNKEQAIDEIAYDFEKLLFVKAPFKLMIFCTKYSDSRTEDLEPQRQAIWTRFHKLMLQYADHVENEQYLFLDVGYRANMKAWGVVIPHSASLDFTNLVRSEVHISDLLTQNIQDV